MVDIKELVKQHPNLGGCTAYQTYGRVCERCLMIEAILSAIHKKGSIDTGIWPEKEEVLGFYYGWRYDPPTITKNRILKSAMVMLETMDFMQKILIDKC
jgi:hypothetical protein